VSQAPTPVVSPRRLILPLALAQFICSFAGSNLNVMINDIQGEISGLSHSISNLGSSFGTAIAGTILVSVVTIGNRSYALAMVALVVFGLIGLGAALFLPAKLERQVG
jgi:multidrug efflux pump subunit AcrB